MIFRKSKNYSCFIFLLLCVSLASCGKDSKKSPAEDANVAIAASLAGTWKSSCTNGVIATFIVTNNTEKSVVTGYSNSSCSSPYLTMTSENTFTIEGAVSGLSNTYKKNNTLTSIKYIVRSDDAVAEANAAALYGYTDWVKDVEKEVTGKKESSSEASEPSVGSVNYTIVKVEDNKWYVPDTDINDGSSEAKRPTSVKTDKFLTKQ